MKISVNEKCQNNIIKESLNDKHLFIYKLTVRWIKAIKFDISVRQGNSVFIDKKFDN